MEVIRFDGYTVDEKVAIARGYLWPRQRERNGLREDEVEIDDAVLETIVAEYTREAGVRQLERELGKLLRKTATRIASGDATAPVAIDLGARARRARPAAVLAGVRRSGRRFPVSRPAWPSPAPAATSSSSRRRAWTGRSGSRSPASSAT